MKVCNCGHPATDHALRFKENSLGACLAAYCRCMSYNATIAPERTVLTEEFGKPETVRETFPNDQNLAGTFVIYCIGENIEVKARGLTPRQVVRILGLIISKII